MFRWRQHRVIDASALALRFAAATLSRDTLRSGQVTVGRAVRKEPITNGDSAIRFDRSGQDLDVMVSWNAVDDKEAVARMERNEIRAMIHPDHLLKQPGQGTPCRSSISIASRRKNGGPV
jgi:hypothetical protein